MFNFHNIREVEEKEKLSERSPPYHDPFTFLVALIKKEIHMNRFDLSSLENNMIVMEILEAAKESARKGKKIKLK